MKIAIINTSFLKEPIEGFVKKFEPEHIFHTYTYRDIIDTKGIIPNIEKEYDGFFVNGEITLSLIKKLFPLLNKPIVNFNSDTMGYYHCILKSTVRDKIPLERIFIDHIPDRKQGDLEYILQDFSSLTGRDYVDYIATLDANKLVEERYRMEERLLTAWKSGEYDLIITRFSTIVEELKEKGVNVKFVYPSESFITLQIRRLIDQIALQVAKSNNSALIMITTKLDETASPQTKELAEVTLKKEILEFRQEQRELFTVNDLGNGFGISTTEKYVSSITKNFTVCPFRIFLEPRFPFKFHVGYGIGYTSQKAALHAVSANRESELSPYSYSFVKNENEKLIGPLGVAEHLVVETAPNEAIAKTAKQAGLSPLTLQRILAVSDALETDTVTAKELSQHLNITARTVNRTLTKLEATGAIQAVGVKQDKNRGRPSTLYKILFS